MKFASLYAIVVGGLMLAQWSFFLIAGMVPEFQTTPVKISFHLIAELLTALALIITGSASLRGKQWGLTLYAVAIGMLIYTVINSAGYFAQLGEWPFVSMFALLLVGALISAWQYWQTQG